MILPALIFALLLQDEAPADLTPEEMLNLPVDSVWEYQMSVRGSEGNTLRLRLYDRSNDVCHVESQEFEDGKEKKARILSLKNLVDKSQALADWPADAHVLGWPKEVGLADGARYLLRLKGSRATRKFTLHLVPGDLPTDAHKAAWMADHGCERQARRLIARLR